ncbi:hypothetical protein KHA90_18505 [Flavobacterium psychroterrae]|uniref:Uncharacterized protein n=1 Tax=Flavobacterium psychroterrae TaxID=2133767 RepID=A0ABS5PFG5_9FLAO|nr:hypothetical protein [Flavobacterium psychroterrae]MBS7233017.1 hypothetical protein [Flavobacterium psychroterrae]
MKLIEKFYCIQTEIFGNGTKNSNGSIVSIKTELLRPSIKILNTNGSINLSESKVYRKRLLSNPYTDSNETFTINELLFLSKTYEFEIEEHFEYKGYFTSVLKIHKLYNTSGNIILTEQDGKEYLMIQFTRWQSESQPRSAGEDSLGEDITYVHGIWESPLLTDEIIAKFLGSNRK